MILIEETDNRFYLKKSGLKDAGTGVFAKGSIKAGEYLEIIGVAVDVPHGRNITNLPPKIKILIDTSSLWDMRQSLTIQATKPYRM